MLHPPRNLSSEWGRLLVDGLVSAGVRDVVIAPGSRSTPFVLAATAQRRLRCVEAADERCGAFFALGQGRASGRPSLFVCTSGTAGAHAFPAVIEASLARVPLLVLTADRPFERRDCGAPQTIDQTRLFGDHVRWFAELGLPDPDQRALRSLQRRALRAVARSLGPIPGPVHLNAPVRKPLEPEDPSALAADETERCAELARRVDAILARPPSFDAAPPSAPTEAVLDRLVDELSAARRPLAVAGPAALARWLDAESMLDSLAVLGLPLYAEATSQLASARACDRSGGAEGANPRSLTGFAGVLGSAAARTALAPDLVLQLGAAPTAGGWEPAIELWCAAGARHVVLADGGWPDPVSTASWVVEGDAATTLRASASRAGARGLSFTRQDDWIDRLERLCRGSEEAAAELSSLEPAGEAPIAEPAAVRAVLEALPEDGLLAVGNSLPIRSVDLYAPRVHARIPVWSQRGANGIDGLVSGAAGALSVWGRAARRDRAPSLGVLLLGDVSLRHDLGGLALLRGALERSTAPAAPRGGQRLLVVLLDNGGGRIFDQLPARDLELGDRWRFWSTPEGPSWPAIASAFGLEYREAATIAELRELLDELISGATGSALLRIEVDPDSARLAGESLRRRIDAVARDAILAAQEGA